MKASTSGNTLYSLLFYSILGLTAFSPTLFAGLSYFDGDLMNSNHIMHDFLRANLLRGHIPLWNPCLFGGQPLWADGDFMQCYPFLYPVLLFPVEFGFGVFHFSCFLIAALGMHLWLKSLRLSEDSCRVGALLFALSGYFWWEIIHPPELAAFAWTPWWAAALEKTSQKLEPLWIFAAGLAFAVLFTAGNFQLTMGALYGGGAYLAFRFWSRRDWWKGKDRGRRLVLAPFFFLWGALPLLVFWIPAWEFMSRCDRLQSHLDYLTFQADYSLNPLRLWQFLFPANPFPNNAGWARPMDDYLANGGYMGPWAFFFMAWAFKRSRTKFLYFMAIAGAAALFLAFGKFTPLHRLACDFVPGIGLARAPFRYVFLYVAAGSVLAAMGYERVLDSLNKAKKSEGGPFLICAGLYGLGIGLFSLVQGWKSWPQWLGLILGLLSFYFLSREGWNPKTRWFFPAALGVGLLITGWTYCTSRLGPNSNFDFTARCPALQKLKEQTGLERVFIGDNVPYPVRSCGGQVLQTVLPSEVVCAVGLRSVVGYNPLNLTKVADLYSLPPRTFARLMGLGAFISGGEGWKGGGFSVEDWDGVQFYKNKEGVRFAYAPRHVETVADSQRQLALMRRPDFNPYDTAYFSEALPEGKNQAMEGPGNVTCELKGAEADVETFQVRMDRPGWTVFSEIMYPGWKAWVDGQPAELYTANHTFRAVWVPEGAHEVTFRYEPVWWKPLMGGLLLWVLSLAGIALGPWRKKILQEFRGN